MGSDKVKLQRLSSAKTISEIFDENRRISSNLGLILWKSEDSEATKVAYCVSKKHGIAVKRNRIKRILRQLVQNHSELLPQKTEFVIVPSAKQKEWTTAGCDEDFQKLLMMV